MFFKTFHRIILLLLFPIMFICDKAQDDLFFQFGKLLCDILVKYFTLKNKIEEVNAGYRKSPRATMTERAQGKVSYWKTQR